jgi:hypothetical protein
MAASLTDAAPRASLPYVFHTLKKIKGGMMKSVIVETGASSGFGALTARELAKAGHTVYAGMRETRQRYALQVKDARKFASENKPDLRTVEMDVPSHIENSKKVRWSPHNFQKLQSNSIRRSWGITRADGAATGESSLISKR